MNNNFTEVINSLTKGMDGFLSAKTVVGQPTTIGDAIIIPLVDVSFGIGAGANAGEKSNGGFGGMTGKMSPSAVLVIKNGQTKLVNIKDQNNIVKIIDAIPDLVDRLTTDKEPMPSDDAAKEAAFPADANTESYL
ncbi:MAG: GerW family sporulation protein [Lachnospiraceae bacterium]|nr:GerW family sporulation protein [Lachnospiraceae bacterium]